MHLIGVAGRGYRGKSRRCLRRLVGLVVKRRLCPLCGWHGFRFEPAGRGAARRQDAVCPGCGAAERHRAALLLLKDRIPKDQKVLHVAPEPALIPWLMSLSSEYLSIDLRAAAMQRMDVTHLDLPDKCKTLMWCSHVLEHIVDDTAALSEAYRILMPGGILILQVPVREGVTLEDFNVTTEEERFKLFLQEDHVRLYGRDLCARIESAGFECEILSVLELARSDQVLHSVNHNFFREVFFCRRPFQ